MVVNITPPAGHEARQEQRQGTSGPGLDVWFEKRMNDVVSGGGRDGAMRGRRRRCGETAPTWRSFLLLLPSSGGRGGFGCLGLLTVFFVSTRTATEGSGARVGSGRGEEGELQGRAQGFIGPNGA